MNQFAAVISYALGVASVLWLLPRRLCSLSIFAALSLSVIALRGGDTYLTYEVFGADGSDLLFESLRAVPIDLTLQWFVRGIAAAVFISAPLLAYRLLASWLSSMILPMAPKQIELVLLVSFFAVILQSDYPVRSLALVAGLDQVVTQVGLTGLITSSFSVAGSLLLPFAALSLCYGITMFLVARFLRRQLAPGHAQVGLQLVLLFLLFFTSYLLEESASKLEPPEPSVTAVDIESMETAFV